MYDIHKQYDIEILGGKNKWVRMSNICLLPAERYLVSAVRLDQFAPNFSAAGQPLKHTERENANSTQVGRTWKNT